jgi:hypothetical protein
MSQGSYESGIGRRDILCSGGSVVFSSLIAASPQRSKGGEHSITRSDHAADAHREAIGLITQFIPGLAISAYFAINFSSPKTCDERAIVLTSCFCSVASFRRRHRLEKNTCVAGRKRLRR